MKLTLGELRRIIRESIEEIVNEIDARSRSTGLGELADVLGFDWYSLTPEEKRDFGDLMIAIKSGANDKRLMLALRNLPLEKNFIASSPGSKFPAPGDFDINVMDLLKKIKTNYSN